MPLTAVLLIRHGQASFGGETYDRLCPRGEQQARLIGAGLRDEGRMPDAVFSGRLVRQARTAALALEEAGLVASPVTDHAAFDEYPSEVLFHDHLPVVAAGDAELAAAGPGFRENRRLFQKALAGVLGRWQAGLPSSGESWVAFRDRVRKGLDAAVTGQAKDAVVAVFTSGGVIGTAVGEVLGLPPDRAIALSWRIHNASVTELTYGRSGFSLGTFNGVSHLRRSGDQTLLTYR